MNNNDIFKKLRVALQLRDDQIVEILELVNFRISKAEIGAFFRSSEHPKYNECGDQVLRNFLNGLVIYLRGTKDNPKAPLEVLKENKAKMPLAKKETPNKPTVNPKLKSKKPVSKVQVVEKTKYKNGKKNV